MSNYVVTQQRIRLNKSLVYSVPLRRWKQMANMQPLTAEDIPIIGTIDGVRSLIATKVNVNRRYLFNADGTLRVTYTHLLMAWQAAQANTQTSEYERVLLSALLEGWGAISLERMLVNLLRDRCSRNHWFNVSFKKTDEGFEYGGNKLLIMQMMAELTRPEGITSEQCFIVSADDVFKYAVAHRVYALSDEKWLKMKDIPQFLKFLDGVSESLECRLAPEVFSNEFGCRTGGFNQMLNQYEAGQLMDFRNVRRGRKPRHENIYLERIYPLQQDVLGQRLSLFKSEVDQCGVRDSSRVYYMTPYWFAFYVPLNSVPHFATLFQTRGGKRVLPITEDSLFTGNLI